MAGVLALAVVPHSGEVFLNLTNIQWPLAAALLLLAAEPVAQSPSRPRLAFAGLAAFTGPFSLLLSPLALRRFYLRQRVDRKIDPIALVVLLGATTQAPILLATSTRAGSASGADFGSVVLATLLSVFPELFGTSHSFPADLHLRLLGATAGVAALLWACAGSTSGSEHRRVLLLGAGIVLLAGIFASISSMGHEPLAFGAGSRYLYVPFVAFVWAMLLALADSNRSRLARLLPCVSLGAVLVNACRLPQAPHFPAPDWASIASHVEAGSIVTFRVAPLLAPVTLLPSGMAAAPK
jgi:hypothetical protein